MKKNRYTLMLVFCLGLLLTGCGAGNKSYEQGLAQAETGNYRKAAEAFKKAIGENGERAEYYIGYGMALNELGEYEEAVKQFERARQDVKNSIANANNKQIFYGEAISYYHLSDYEKSLECCEQALEFTEPESMDVDILCSSAAVLETLGETQEALKAYGLAIEKDEEAWGVYLKRASLEERTDQAQDAKADYQKVIQGGGKEKYEACFKLYELCLTLGETDTPDQALQEIISSKDKDAFSICQIGWAYHCQGENDKAQEYLEKSLKDGYDEAGYYLGMMAMEEKDYAGAKPFFEAYVSSGQGQLQAMAYNQLAGCSLEGGELEEAQSYLEKGLAAADSGSRASLWKNKIILLERQGQFKEAGKAVKEYLAVYPKDKKMRREWKFIKTRKQKKEKKSDSEKTSGEDVVGSTPEPEESAAPRGAAQEMIQ